jgi:hypothetical protein
VAARILSRYSADWIRRQLSGGGESYRVAIQTMHLLIHYRPSSALRVLRATRPKSIRNDSAEEDIERRHLLAACFDALGRHQFAAEMRQVK